MRFRVAFASAVGLWIGCAACGGDPSRVTSPGGVPGNLTTLVEVTNAVDVTAGGTGTFNWAGQSVKVPAGPAYNNIRFNWYNFQKAPVAFGKLYVLTQEYLGVPSGLSTSMPGFVARSDSTTDTQYVFAPSVTLNGGTTYWFYTDTQGSFAGSFDQDIYPAGDLYLTGYPTNPFRKAHASGRMVGGTYVPPPDVYIDGNFRLQGAPVSPAR